MSTVVDELIESRKTLEQQFVELSGHVDDADKEAARQEILRVFKTVMSHTATVNLLEQTRIGDTLQKFKQEFRDHVIGAEAKKVLSKWRVDLCGPTDSKDKSTTKPQKTARKEEASTNEAQATKKPKLERQPSDDSIQESADQLPPKRKKIFDKFLECLKVSNPDVDNLEISFLAEVIECSLNDYLPFEKNFDEYRSKAMNLTFNLKQNPELSKDLLSGGLAPPSFVRKSSKDLAPAHLAAERQKRQEMLLSSKRTDIYDVARQQIQMDNNLCQETEFQCKKCKSTRTTHYAMQTRSSDEPMTIFVCCLACKFRWRC